MRVSSPRNKIIFIYIGRVYHGCAGTTVDHNFNLYISLTYTNFLWTHFF